MPDGSDDEGSKSSDVVFLPRAARLEAVDEETSSPPPPPLVFIPPVAPLEPESPSSVPGAVQSNTVGGYGQHVPDSRRAPLPGQRSVGGVASRRSSGISVSSKDEDSGDRDEESVIPLRGPKAEDAEDDSRTSLAHATEDFGNMEIQDAAEGTSSEIEETGALEGPLRAPEGPGNATAAAAGTPAPEDSSPPDEEGEEEGGRRRFCCFGRR